MTTRRVAAFALCLCVVAACSSSSKKAAPPPAAGAQTATGPPVLIGLINQENSAGGSFPEVRQSVEAAVKYVNGALNGIGGHPIQLEKCTTSGSPESSQGCANKLRAKGVVAVIGGVDLGAGSSLGVLEKAKIPYVSASPALGDELTSDDAFMLTGGTAADLLGQANYVTDTLHAKKVGILYIDLPGLLSTAVGATREVLQKKGVTSVKLVSAKADSQDMTPALTQANDGNPDAIVAVFPAQGCARIMQAKQSLGIKAKMFYPGACAEQAVFKTAGAGAEGAYFASGFVPYNDRSNPDVALFQDNDPGKPSALAQAGFGVVMDLHALLDATPSPLTTDSVTAAFKGTRSQPGFMSHDYTCDGKQVELLSAICNSNVRLLHYGSGTFTDVVGDWVNGADLVKLFTG